ncbi:TolC family protein [Halanaerobiaceae bacterium Z-7014]|uniref:TolC family protein n=1 Tax=Halonatronomonas betaini TaxID=2778430 RepID=A0A931AVL2_9FIRM|nr:TolC family protein [Halonatronomonas betaini]MBF8437300.1 TolC family protein [Halonatronomonas betaini]
MKAKLLEKIKVSSVFIVLFIISALIFGPVRVGAVDYENLSLEESLEIALENNRGLLASGEELKGVRTSVDMAEAARLPNISISSSYMRFGGDQEQFDFEIDGSNIQDIAGEFGFPLDDDAADEIAGSFTDIFGPIGEGFEQPDSIFQTELSLQQPLYTFGRISSGIDQAKAGYSAAEAGFEGDRQELIHEVITTYNNVLLAEELLELQHDIKEQVETHLDVVQSNLDAGMVTELDRHEAMVALSEVEQEIVEARSNLELAREGFRSLLGLERGIEIGLAGSYDEAFINLEDEVLKMAEENQLIDLEDNPQLEALAYQREASEASLEMTEAERFPTIAMVGNYSWEDEDIGFEDSSWSIGVNVSFDIFDGGQRRAEIEQAEAEMRQLEYNRQEAEDGLYIEANRALNAFYDAISQEELTAQMQEQAEEQLRLAELRYSEGVGTSTDVIDARAGYSQARLAGEEARYSRIESLADLYLVLGRTDKLLEEVK